MVRFSGVTTLFDAVSSDEGPVEVTKVFALGPASELLLMHVIEELPGEDAVGGKVALAFCSDASGTRAVPAHADAVGLPTGNVVAGYSAIVRGCSEYVKVTLSFSDGTHSVYAEVLG